jgi:signal transduction histidine kinase
VPGDDFLATLRADLFGAEQAVPVVAIREGHVRACNVAASSLFTNVRIGAEIGRYFDARSRQKLSHFLRRGESGVTPELQVERAEGPPVVARFLFLNAPDEQLLVAQDGPGYPVEIGAKLMAANSKLSSTARELSRRMHDLEDAKSAMQRLGDLRELFIAALAHDLKGPLNVILSSEAVLRKEAPRSNPSAQAMELHAGRVERSARQMLTLIDGLLLAAHLDAATPSSIAEGFEVVRLDDLARAAVDDVAPLADDARVRIAVTSSNKKVVCVRGNRTWLGQVFSNLLTNAVRHSPADASVEVAVATSGPVALCTVLDHGPGVPPADREGIFARSFQRGEHRGSIGLGLYICRKIVDLHGGRIWVEDTASGGARFAFEIPRADAVAT